MITATKRVRKRARAATRMMTPMKRERVTRVAVDEKGDGNGNEEGDGDQRRQHGQWLRQR
jgi:hypothetical protein